MNCKYCKAKCAKDGLQANGTQRYKCEKCKKRQQQKYQYTAYATGLNDKIISLTKEGVGIRSTSRLLNISTTTLLNRIIRIAKTIQRPSISMKGTYEVDEMRSFIRRKDSLIWIVYALDRKTKDVVSFNIGSRTKKTLNVVLETLSLSNAKKIYTDRLRHYKSLIDKTVHSTRHRGTNHIERNNLTVRTHLKRLSRKTICFSRSLTILSAILKIYFWA